MGRRDEDTLTMALTQSDFEDQADFRYGLRRFIRFSEVQARKAGITPQQHLLLLMIRGHPSYPCVNITDVAERLQIKHHSASLLVERSVQRGLVARSMDLADRRRALVSLTPHGLDVLERITEANRAELRELESRLFRKSFIQAVRQSKPQ